MRGGNAVDVDAVEDVLRWQVRLRLVVELLAGDDMDVVAAGRQVGGDVTDQLACGGVVRREEAIEKKTRGMKG